MSLNRLTLVLNASYEAVNVCTARRALTLVLKGAAVVERVSQFTVKTPQMRIPIPSVVRLREYRRLPRHNRSVSRKGILLRDRNTCQYCGRLFPAASLTLDHVTPRSRGGASVWENLVAACFGCNNRKGDRTPQECGMTLLKKPTQVSVHAKHRLMAGADDAAWNEFLFC